mmetsp:Transcript_21898/g.62087  ORF Transcript_21898/g.62087 Transcript_21898/m.62087 type:complete len:449 (+) Transcript_21898:67-1413(+)
MEKVAVTALTWIPKGRIAVRKPGDGAAESEAQMLEMHEDLAASGRAASSSSAAHAGTTGLEEFDLHNYDDEGAADGMQFFSVLNNDAPLAFAKDPLMKGDPDSESDGDFDEIGPEDAVFTAVSCEEDECQLEVYIFDDERATMHVHHDISLQAYPLCIEWLDLACKAEGSFAAVGMIDHTLQLWDLQEMDPAEPVVALGKAKPKAGKKKKSSAGPKAHDGPVLCVHGSVFNRSVLASGSADETLKVWDVSENTCVHTYAHHSSKVQCARWHPTEQAVLLSAAFDRKLGLLDVRQPKQVAMVDLPAEAESAIWRRHAPFECLASVDNGGVACYDVRKIVAKEEGARLWTLMAHDVACTAVQDCPTQDLLVTTGLDGVAKVWSTKSAPSLVLSKDLKAGPLFACQSSPEVPALMCFGGNCPVMWDLASEDLLVDVFGLVPTVTPSVDVDA